MTDTGKLGVAVVGLGLVGAEHLKAYRANSDCRITALCSRDPA